MTNVSFLEKIFTFGVYNGTHESLAIVLIVYYTFGLFLDAAFMIIFCCSNNVKKNTLYADLFSLFVTVTTSCFCLYSIIDHSNKVNWILPLLGIGIADFSGLLCYVLYVRPILSFDGIIKKDNKFDENEYLGQEK